MAAAADLPTPRTIHATMVGLSMKIVLSSNPQVVKVYRESAEEYRAVFVDFLQRQIKFLDTTNNPLKLGNAISLFPLDTNGQSFWHGTDLSSNIIIKPIVSLPAPDHDPVMIDILNDASIELLDIDVKFSDDVDVRMSCMVLSCLLQYTPALLGTQRYLGALRRCILSELVQEIKRRSLVQFDSGNLHAALEEWIGMPRDLEDSDSASECDSESGIRSNLPYGRSAGLIITGPKGVGKTYFSKEMVNTIRELAPWLVTVLTKNHVMNSDASVNADTFDDFFDGRKIRELATNDDISPVRAIFDAMKAIYVPGKIVVTFIDDVDCLASKKLNVLSELKNLIDNADYEFFIFGATGDAFHAGGDAGPEKRSYYLHQFRTLNIYNLSLEQAYDYIVDHICDAPVLPYPETIMNGVRSCGRAAKFASVFLAPNHCDAMLASRRDIELRLHNMSISDLDKIILQTSIFLANRFSNESELLTSQAEIEYLRIFEDALESIINSIDVIMGLSPTVISSSDWIRHDTHFHPSIPGIVQSIFQKATCYGQYIHFVKLVPPGETSTMSNNLESLCQSDHLLPSSSSFSLLYHLHRVFAFHSSYILEAPDQLLHSGKKSPTGNGAISPRGGSRPGNPFDDYFWHHHHALLLMPHLETLVGFQQETRVSTSSGMSSGRSTGASTSTANTLSTTINATVGMLSQVAHAVTIADTTTHNIGTGSSTGLGASTSISPVGMDVGGDSNWGRSQSQTLAKGMEHAYNRNTTFMPMASFGWTQAVMRSAGKSLSEGKNDGESSGESREEKRTFRHPEAMTKVVVGLKNLSESRARDLDELRNLVIIFYTHDGCYQEVVRNRLGWNEDGQYPARPVGCAHYHRYLRMKASCCGEWVDCEHCHDERFPDHQMNRLDVKEIQCLHCYVSQPIGTSDATAGRCSNANCGRRLAVSVCLECRLWRDYLPPDGFKHCSTCSKCYPIRFFEFHTHLCASGLLAAPESSKPSAYFDGKKSVKDKERLTARAIQIMRSLEQDAEKRSTSSRATRL